MTGSNPSTSTTQEDIDRYVALTKKVNARSKAGIKLLEWYETTHGNEFGHDHHCPITGTGIGEGCTCGWTDFLVAYAEYEAILNGTTSS